MTDSPEVLMAFHHYWREIKCPSWACICFHIQKNYYETLKLLSPHLSSVTLLDVQKAFIPLFNDRGFGIKINVL